MPSKAKVNEYSRNRARNRKKEYLNNKVCQICNLRPATRVQGASTHKKPFSFTMSRDRIEKILKTAKLLCLDCFNIKFRENHSRIHTKHGHWIGNKSTRTYRSWSCMKKRCLNPKDTNFKNYGGRGIKICKRWIDSFENFLEDMGERPEGTTMDRINPNGDYEPSNCRWASNIVQANNKKKPTVKELLAYISKLQDKLDAKKENNNE